MNPNAVIRAVTVAMCAAMHHLMKMAANASETDSDGILPLHTEEEKEEEIQAYIYTLDFTEASYLWRIPPPNKGASFPPRQVS